MFSISGILTTKDKQYSGFVTVPFIHDTIYEIVDVSFVYGDSVVISSTSRKKCAVCAEQIIKTFKPLGCNAFLSLEYKFEADFNLWSATLKIVGGF